MKTPSLFLTTFALLLTGLAPARADILYVSTINGTQSIFKYNSAGTQSLFATTGNPGAYDLAFDSAGLLYAARFNGATVTRYTTAGSSSLFADSSDGLTNPPGLALAPTGDLFVSDFTNDSITRFNTTTGVGTLFADSTDGLRGPWGMAFDAAGFLYAADANANSIFKFDITGVGTVFANSTALLGGPRYLAFNATGDLFVSNGNSIRLTPGGVGTVFADSADGVSNPYDLAFDSAGRLYVAQFGGNTALRYGRECQRLRHRPDQPHRPCLYQRRRRAPLPPRPRIRQCAAPPRRRGNAGRLPARAARSSNAFPRPTPMKTHRLFALTVVLLFATAGLTPAHGQITQNWFTQWGTTASDAGFGVDVDATGRTWVTGHTNGILGASSAGSFDFFLTPLSTTGVLGTSLQRGGNDFDAAAAVAIVGGNTVFSVGYTNSATWDGAAVVGSTDSAAVGYSTIGTYQSTTRWGTTSGDASVGAAGNATHLLTASHTTEGTGNIDGQPLSGNGDAFLSKRTGTGALVWTRVVGTASRDQGNAAAFDTAGNAYLAGQTTGSLPTFSNPGQDDIFLARYDATGNRTLLRQWGTDRYDVATDIEVDVSGNIYLTGYTSGALGGQANNGEFDAFLIKLDSTGNVLWTRLFGGTSAELSHGLALDTAGRVWIGGYTYSSFAGHTNAGSSDAFVALYETSGTLLGTRFWGTDSSEEITGLAAAANGSVSASGHTGGTLGTSSSGGTDAFAVSVTAVPEPTSALLLVGGVGIWAGFRRGRRRS